jgi:hypothetical protein
MAVPKHLCEKCEKRVECLKEVDGIPTVITAGPEEHCIKARKFTVLCPSSNFPWEIGVPEAVEIGSPGTLNRSAKLTQEELDLLFVVGAEELFDMVFKTQDIKMPKTVEELSVAGAGVNHVLGIITMIMEAFAQGNHKIFLQFPETHLHPKAVMGLVDMLRFILQGGAHGISGKEPGEASTDSD